MAKIEGLVWHLTVNQKGLPYPWVHGTLEETYFDGIFIANSYGFKAKVYDEGSKFGINNGRISKLFVWKSELGRICNRKVANYDRGWDMQPTDKTEKEVLQRIIDGLEKSPKTKV